MKQKKDFDRSGPTFKKIFQLFKLFLPKYTKTLARLDKFEDLDIDKLNKIKNLNIKGIILDVDECISENHKEILKENVEHIKKLHEKGIKIAIYSNAKKAERYDIIKNYAEILTNIPAKPDERGFNQALKILDLKPKNVIMVGDNYITDCGSVMLGIQFVKIKPIKTHYDNFLAAVIMGIYTILRNFYDFISRVHDLFREKPLTGKNLSGER